MNVWIVTGIYLAVAGLGVGIFLYGKPSGNSLFDRLYQIVCMQGPRLLKKVLEKVFGKRAPKMLDDLWTYLCYTSNPLVQVFYLLVVIGGYLVFAIYGYAYLPNRFLDGWHKYTGFILFNNCLWVWWKACRSDPGSITTENVDELCEIFEWDETIFSASECPTCNLMKPGRSKHCALCDCCISRFDHHCIWINNCVGVGNHKWFLAFLFSHLMICAYGAALGSIIVYDLVLQKDLMNAVFVDPVSKERHTASYLIVVQYMLATEGMVIFVTALCLIMGLVLAGFFLWHLNLVRIGTTTNELSKWNFVRWCLKQEGEEGKAKLKDLCNIYNKGFVANFREVLCPVDVHNLPGRQALLEAADKAATTSSGGGEKTGNGVEQTNGGSKEKKAEKGKRAKKRD
jgi:palmitoyltransferase